MLLFAQCKIMAWCPIDGAGFDVFSSVNNKRDNILRSTLRFFRLSNCEFVGRDKKTFLSSS